MLAFDRRNQLLAVSLAGLAGFVDATGFIATGGFFLSFMSGNSTRLGVGLAGIGADAVMAGTLILAFVGGVVAGTLTGRASGRHHRPAVLMLLAGTLSLAALLAGIWPMPAFLLTAFAMGAENTVFETDGEVRISLTYMTGNLVKAGQRLARAIAGGPRWQWLPYLALWSAMVGGAVAGAVLWPVLGLASLWAAALAALLLAAASRHIETRNYPQL